MIKRLPQVLDRELWYRLIIFLLVLFFDQTNLFAQQSVNNISLNNVKATFDSKGRLFSANLNGSIQSGFEYPKGTNKNTIFTSSFWVSGVDSATSILYTSANTFPNSFNSFFSGPIRNTPFSNNSRNGCFKISKSEVIDFQQQFGTPGYIIPSPILNWPGNGNANDGMTQNLAPYEDINANAIYEPITIAEYPRVFGGDNLYFLNNDISGSRTGLNSSNPLELEIETYAYELESEYEILADCIFLNVQLKNRSLRTYEDMYIGLWFDFDIGDSNDDFIGCDSNLNLFYAYNGDNNDPVYGNFIPAQGVMILNQSLSSFIAYNNSNNSLNGNPNSITDFNNFLRAKWKDGSAIQNVGNGTGTSGSNTNFLYNFGVNQEIGAGGDKRGIGNLGPIKLRSNEIFCFDFVVFPAIDSTINSNYQSLLKLISKADTIQSVFNLIGQGCPSTIISNMEDLLPIANSEIKVYPNPSSTLLNLESINNLGEWKIELIQIASGISVIRSNGHGLLSQSINIRNLKPGIYIVTVRTKDNLFKQKIVIND